MYVNTMTVKAVRNAACPLQRKLDSSIQLSGRPRDDPTELRRSYR
jgi:hypothetical protein